MLQCGEDDGVGKGKSGPIAYRAISGRLAYRGINWKVTALEAEVWVETVSEGGQRFLAAWGKERGERDY